MFDPTVFDNLKVAFENEVYDLDNIEQAITVSARKDTIELADMSREFKLRFYLNGAPSIQAEICLQASLKELAAEILEQQGVEPGCRLTISFHLNVTDAERQCEEIANKLYTVWQDAAKLRQTLRYIWEDGMASKPSTKAELLFHRKITEEQMDDISELVSYTLHSLERLADIHVNQ